MENHSLRKTMNQRSSLHHSVQKLLLLLLLLLLGFSDSIHGFVFSRPALQRSPGALAHPGLDAESDSVGPGIYGGVVERNADGSAVIGQQYEQHNPRPGPVYAGGGYTAFNAAVRAGADAVTAFLREEEENRGDGSMLLPFLCEESTGGATPLHICGMTEGAQHSAATIVAALSSSAASSLSSSSSTSPERILSETLEKRDLWGYTPLQRCATNNLAVAAEVLINAGASHTSGSGVDGTGESARDLARRLRSFAVLRVFQQWELAQGMPLPDGEVEL